MAACTYGLCDLRLQSALATLASQWGRHGPSIGRLDKKKRDEEISQEKKRRRNFAPLTRARPGRIFRICSPYCLISPLSFATFLSTEADLPSVCKK
jgi:hypothetical protein